MPVFSFPLPCSPCCLIVTTKGNTQNPQDVNLSRHALKSASFRHSGSLPSRNDSVTLPGKPCRTTPQIPGSARREPPAALRLCGSLALHAGESISCRRGSPNTELAVNWKAVPLGGGGAVCVFACHALHVVRGDEDGGLRRERKEEDDLMRIKAADIMTMKLTIQSTDTPFFTPFQKPSRSNHKPGRQTHQQGGVSRNRTKRPPQLPFVCLHPATTAGAGEREPAGPRSSRELPWLPAPAAVFSFPSSSSQGAWPRQAGPVVCPTARHGSHSSQAVGTGGGLPVT